MAEEGEELENTEEGEERSRELVQRALSGRNLTPEEEEQKEQMEQVEENREDVIHNDKTQNTLSVIAAVILAVIILIITLVVKKGQGEQDEGEADPEF